MSVYSGFATRLLESQYNGLVCKLIALFDQRVRAALGAREADFFDSEQWTLSFCSVFKAMKKLEGQKYLPPKYSHYCTELAQYVGAYVSLHTDAGNVERHLHELQQNVVKPE